MQSVTIQSNKKFKTGWIIPPLTAGCLFFAFVWFSSVQAGTSSVSLNTWFVDMERYEGSAHGTLTCEECHGSMIGQTAGKSIKHPDPKAVDFLKTPAKRNFDYQLCNNCHESEYDSFLKGEHAKEAIKEKEDRKPSENALSCGDCHSAHYP